MSVGLLGEIGVLVTMTGGQKTASGDLHCVVVAEEVIIVRELPNLWGGWS